ncbi:hypothetical protein [Serratia entomophila]|uniref:hypothetical protein n=1 Tax=Serratia entomophila TaxID=42906 RepID=UPI00217C6662|nr:hypothetical protein [Serratia entomophila]CAI1744431.1 Uncharacterised protein [Serratia entomophila]
MAKLTKAEKKWLDELQEVLNRCPTDRLGFYTVGDPDITVYDRSKEDSINTILDTSDSDWDSCVIKAKANLDASIIFPAAVHSTAG